MADKADLEARVKALEDEVFGGGGSGLRLSQIETELKKLMKTSATAASVAELEEKLDEVIKIVAELRTMVAGQKLRVRGA